MTDIALLKSAIGKRIGYGNWGSLGIGGQCGEFSSWWMTQLTGGKYQFGTGVVAEQWTPSASNSTAWDVYTTTDWKAIGWKYINRPAIGDLKAGDIFFIAPRYNLATGHTGVVLSVSNGQVTTLEQNFGGRMVVTQYVGGSWSYFGGFDGIVRPVDQPSPPKPTGKEEDEDMRIITITSDADYYGKKFKSGACFCVNGSDIRYIERPQTLTNLQGIGVPKFSMSHVDLLYIIQDLGLKLLN